MPTPKKPASKTTAPKKSGAAPKAGGKPPGGKPPGDKPPGDKSPGGAKPKPADMSFGPVKTSKAVAPNFRDVPVRERVQWVFKFMGLLVLDSITWTLNHTLGALWSWTGRHQWSRYAATSVASILAVLGIQSYPVWAASRPQPFAVAASRVAADIKPPAVVDAPPADTTPPVVVTTPPADTTPPVVVSTPPADVTTPPVVVSTPPADVKPPVVTPTPPADVKPPVVAAAPPARTKAPLTETRRPTVVAKRIEILDVPKGSILPLDWASTNNPGPLANSATHEEITVRLFGNPAEIFAAIREVQTAIRGANVAMRAEQSPSDGYVDVCLLFENWYIRQTDPAINKLSLAVLNSTNGLRGELRKGHNQFANPHEFGTARMVLVGR